MYVGVLCLVDYGASVMKDLGIIYAAALIIILIMAAFLATSCSTKSRLRECEWDASCDYAPPEAVNFDDGHPLFQDVPKPKKHLKKK